jgi:hypothetical protein
MDRWTDEQMDRRTDDMTILVGHIFKKKVVQMKVYTSQIASSHQLLPSAFSLMLTGNAEFKWLLKEGDNGQIPHPQRTT